MPFSYTPHLRFTPLIAGPAVDFNLSALEHPVTVRQDWQPVFLQKENVNRKVRNTLIGWRLSIVMAFEVLFDSASETTLVNMGKRLMVPGEVMEVSLDGSFYRNCSLVSWNRAPDSEKNVDLIYTLVVVLDDLIDADVIAPETLTAPPLASGWA